MTQALKVIIIHPPNTDDEVLNKLNVTTIVDFELNVYKNVRVIDIICKLTSRRLIPDYLNEDDYKFQISELGTDTEIEKSHTLALDDANNGLVIKVIPTHLYHGYFNAIVEFWNAIYPYLDQVGTVMGITGGTIGFGMWIKKRFEKKYTPKQFVNKVTEKELWNAHELALTLNITDDEAKNLLKGFGYKWDRKYSLYVKTDKTVEIIEKMQNYDL